jgi:hypothetical protein
MGRGRAVPKVSRRPGLPSVMASPVKGGETEIPASMEDEMESCRETDVVMEGVSTFETVGSGDDIIAGNGKGKEKEKDVGVDAWKKNASRRASLASQALSQSLSELPPPTTKPRLGSMGPPAIPIKQGGATSAAVSASGRALRSSARIAVAKASSGNATAALEKDNDVTRGESSSGKNAKQKAAGAGSLGVMKDCTVFVDVRTDDGDNAGGLFVQMLRDMGARVSLVTLLWTEGLMLVFCCRF